MKRFSKILLLLLLSILALSLIIHSLGTRNGVTAAQVSETLPGDEIIPNTWITIDRAATLPVPSSQAWPWVQQLGKDRAGWYAPLWMENLLKAQAASSTLPQYQARSFRTGAAVRSRFWRSSKITTSCTDRSIRAKQPPPRSRTDSYGHSCLRTIRRAARHSICACGLRSPPAARHISFLPRFPV
jgi:hypothetical protein